MSDTQITPADVIRAVRATGGYRGRLAKRYGLYKQLVNNWRRRQRVPPPWPLLIGSAVRREVTKIVTS